MKKTLILLICTSLLTACDFINLQSEIDCRNINTEIREKAEKELLPELKTIKTIDEYTLFIKSNYEYISKMDSEFRECMSSSAFTANKEEMNQWIQAGVHLNMLSISWGGFIEKPETNSVTDLDYYLQDTAHLLKNIFDEKEI